VIWPQNYLDGFYWFGLKTSGYDFCWFGLKTSGDDFRWFGLKTSGDGFLQFGLKTGGDGFSRFGLKTGSYWFGDLGLKITPTVSWFGPQNHAGFGLSVAPQNRRREVCAGHVSRSSGLLGMKASPDRIFQSGLKTSGGVMMAGARGTIVEVASEAS
jgi:hypothetical protein